MKKRHVLSIVVCLFLFGQCLIMAQTEGPKVLWIFREDVKVARGMAHNRVEQGFAQFWAKGQVQPFLAMEAVSGNATEILFVSGYDSFASFEKDLQAFNKATSGPRKVEYEGLAKQEAELVNSVRSMVALYRPELSYRADKIMPNLPKARYMEITVMRTRVGKEEAFAAGAKLFKGAYEKLNIDMPWAIFEAEEGAPGGMYLLFTPMKSLKEIDDALAMESKIMAAIGAEALKGMDKEMADIIVSIESNLYAFNPQISHVSKDFAAGDAEFWIPKATQPPPAAPKKPAK